MANNEIRASWAADVVERYAALAGSLDEDVSDNLRDLLVNLRHLAFQNDLPYEEIDKHARELFEVELKEEADLE